MNFVTGGKALVRMPRGKKQKSPEEEQELLEDLYTNRNFSGTTHNLYLCYLYFDTVHFFKYLTMLWPSALATQISRKICTTTSVPNRQNTVPLHLEKWRYRALKFLVHFSSFLLTNVPQKQCKVGILKK